jgi:hypothetical protein
MATDQEKAAILERLDALSESEVALMWKIIANLVDVLEKHPLPTKAEGAEHES